MRLVPSTMGDVTSEWLEAVLRERGWLDGAGVAGVTVEPLGEGVGLLGDLARIRPRYTGDTSRLPETLIVKLPSGHEENRNRGNQFGFYEREIRFYEELGAKLEVRVPRCYHAAVDADAGSFVLLLEDLAHMVTADQVEGLTEAQARVAAEHIARFHASWWDAPALEALEWLPRSDGPVTMQAAPTYRQCWPLFLDRLGDSVPEGGVAVGEAVGEAYESLLELGAMRPWTIVHTDFRLDNMFFGAPGTDEEFALVDWQLTTKGGGCYDIAYLLCQSMPVDRRRAVEERVLRQWWDVLTASGVRNYSWERAVEDYDRSALVCLVIPVIAGATMDFGNERGEALVRALVERSFTAVLDRDAARLLPD
jgi:phosphotransferase family enzyme